MIKYDEYSKTGEVFKLISLTFSKFKSQKMEKVFLRLEIYLNMGDLF